MQFTFVHTADWQIGKAFGSLPADKAPLLREARLSVIDRIATLVRAAGARHVLVAGDVFDSGSVPDRDLIQSFERLRRHEDVGWHFLPGNHDPVRAGGIWERVVRLGMPANVVLHLEVGASALCPGVTLLAAPLDGKSAADDPTAYMDRCPTAPGSHRIGLAHGSVQGFGGQGGEAKVPIAFNRAERAGLSYLALGDWHGVTRIGGRTWYSGTPEPDRFHENEPGYALVVRLRSVGDAPVVERHPTAQFQWWKRALPLAGPDSLAPLEQAIGQAIERPECFLLRLALEGTASLRMWSDLEPRLVALSQRLFHAEISSERVILRPEAIELDDFGRGDLGEVARSLSALAADTASGDGNIAALALRKLHQWHRTTRQEEAA